MFSGSDSRSIMPSLSQITDCHPPRQFCQRRDCHQPSFEINSSKTESTRHDVFRVALGGIPKRDTSVDYAALGGISLKDEIESKNDIWVNIIFLV